MLTTRKKTYHLNNSHDLQNKQLIITNLKHQKKMKFITLEHLKISFYLSFCFFFSSSIVIQTSVSCIVSNACISSKVYFIHAFWQINPSLIKKKEKVKINESDTMPITTYSAAFGFITYSSLGIESKQWQFEPYKLWLVSCFALGMRVSRLTVVGMCSLNKLLLFNCKHVTALLAQMSYFWSNSVTKASFCPHNGKRKL